MPTRQEAPHVDEKVNRTERIRAGRESFDRELTNSGSASHVVDIMLSSQARGLALFMAFTRTEASMMLSFARPMRDGSHVPATRLDRLNRPMGTFLLLTAVITVWTSVRFDVADDGVGLVGQVPWVAAAAVALLAGLVAVHYISAAIALRAVSDQQVPLGPTLLVQFAAAATNRLVPNGLGAAGVNLRYLLRSGMNIGAATTSLATLGIVGLITDVAYGAGVTAIGPALGVYGATQELRSLAGHGLRAGRKNYWFLLAVVIVGLVVITVRYRGAFFGQTAAAVRQAAGHLRELARHRTRVLLAALASAVTTVMMSIGFVVAVRVWGKAAHPLAAGALVAIYLFASAAGGALPLPPIIGMTEMALVGGLVVGGYSSGSAILAVVTFRVIAYWLPLPIGVWAARRLRRAQML